MITKLIQFNNLLHPSDCGFYSNQMESMAVRGSFSGGGGGGVNYEICTTYVNFIDPFKKGLLTPNLGV